MAVDGMIFFTADDGVHGRELWKTDGTPGGTVLVADIRPGSEGSNPRFLTELNGAIFFAADDGTHGYELWRSDGTSAGTAIVADVWPGSTGSGAGAAMRNVAGTLFFQANDGVHGAELWRSDGTPSGTALVKDINPGSEGSDALGFGGPHSAAVGQTLFFVAADDVHGLELWRTDGTAAGTVMLKDIQPDEETLGLDTAPLYLTDVDGTLFFSAHEADLNGELWKSDGTPDGTLKVKEICPGTDHQQPLWLTDVGGTLFFAHSDGTHGLELWTSDGTETGTTMVLDIWPGSFGSVGGDIAAVEGTAYFYAADQTGPALWRSDGSSAGTLLVRPFGRPVESLTDLDGTLFFSADDGENGRELWRSDGTPAGTVMVGDIYPGNDSWGNPHSSDPDNLTSIDGTLFFSAASPATGNELWVVQGGELPDIGDTLADPYSLGTLTGGTRLLSETRIGDGYYGDKDVDLYRFSLSDEAAVTIDVDAETAGSGLDAYLRLLDDQGQEIASNNDHDGLDPLVSVHLGAGTYFVGVSGSPNGSYDPRAGGSGIDGSTGPYALSATVVITNGPHVVDCSPPSPIAVLSWIEFEFNEPIREGTLTMDDVHLEGPGGEVAIASVVSAGGSIYRIEFADQVDSGIYTLSVGPHVEDVAGNLMDQDCDGLNGESLDDVFVQEFVIPSVSVSGAISFRDRADNSLARKHIPRAVAVTVWADESQDYQWPVGPLLGSTIVPNEYGDDDVYYDVFTGPLLWDQSYSVAFSVLGSDRKIIRTQGNAPSNVDVTLTYEDVEADLPSACEFARETGAGITYSFAEDEFTQDEEDAIEFALDIWEGTKRVSFTKDDNGGADITFRKRKTDSDLGGWMGKASASWDRRDREWKWEVDFATNGLWTSSNHLVVSGQNWRSAVRSEATGLAMKVLASAALHEVGHVLGLRYPTRWGSENVFPDRSEGGQWSIMTYGSFAKTLWLGWSDVAAIREINENSIEVTAYCPVDLVVTDSQGRTVSKALNEIPGAVYTEEDLDGSGDLDDRIIVPEPQTGGYTVQVVPEAGAAPDEMVTVILEDHGKPTILLDNVRVADLPEDPILLTVDRTAPTLAVSVSPSQVPAAGAWVPVHVDLQVQDETDPDPEVMLVSIDPSWQTDPQGVVRGADLGQDDRDFELLGDPATVQRSYTLMYAASDATGNVTYATATVYVDPVSPGPIYVDDDAPNDPAPGDPGVSDPDEDGSVQHPFDSIQEGIDAAQDGDTVVVLSGTYTGTDNRDIEFRGKAITVCGVNPQNPAVVEATVVDCQGSEAENHRGFYFHAQEGTDSVLAGLTITGGCHSAGGGGLYVLSSSPTIRHNLIRTNTGRDGAGIYSSNGSPAITYNRILDNVSSDDGGGIAARGGAATIESNVIRGNTADYGGGVYLPAAGGSVRLNTIEDNQAHSGGGIYAWGDVAVRENSIAANQATWGGGAYLSGAYSGTFGQNAVTENQAEKGGGLFISQSGIVTVQGNVIRGNMALTEEGGGVYCQFSAARLLENLIAENVSQNSYGGGVYCIWSPSILERNVLLDNRSAEDGQSVSVYGRSPQLVNNVLYLDPDDPSIDPSLDQIGCRSAAAPLILNTVIWGPPGCRSVDESRAQLYFCDTSDGVGPTGHGNTSTDPVFVDPDDPLGPDGLWGTADDGFRLDPMSPCVHAGDPAFRDDDGSRSDIGAYGNALPGSVQTECFVDGLNAMGPWLGTAEHPYRHIWQGIRAVADGGTVHVDSGTYEENLLLVDKTVALLGAGADDVTIDGGERTGILEIHFADGVEIGDLTFLSGRAYEGGGINAEDSSVHVHDCVFRDNYGTMDAGAVNLAGTHAVIERCLFEGNSTVNKGGAISWMWGSSGRVSECVFIGGSAHWGGAICIRSEGEFTNNLFLANSAGYNGGAVSVRSIAGSVPFPVVACSTFVGNTASNQGGGLCVVDDRASVRNCIFWGNSAPEGPELACHADTTLEVGYCDVLGGEAGVYCSESGDGGELIWGYGNIDTDPLFADPAAGDYHLKSDQGRWDPVSRSWVTDPVRSPVINRGDPDAPVGQEPDPNGERLNMGAYAGTPFASKADKTLHIVAITPPIDSQTDQLLTRVEVQFSKSVNEDTLVPAYFALVGSGGDGSFGDGNERDIEIEAVTWDSENCIAAVLIDPGLPRDAYRLTVKDAIATHAGERLDGEFYGRLPSGDAVEGGDHSAVFSVVNTPPILRPDQAATDEDTPTDSIDVLANDVDLDGDPLTLVSFSQPAFGFVVNNGDGTFTYTPFPDLHETDSFTYAVRDDHGSEETATVTVTVRSVNDLPHADAGDGQGLVDTDGDGYEAVSLDGSASSDVEGIASYQWNENGIEIAGGPAPGADVDLLIGRHWITLGVTDGDAATATDEVVVDVWPRPSAGGPAILANPVEASIHQREHPYRLMWTGDATPRLWTFGPTGLRIIADPNDIPAGQHYHDWDVPGAAAGWYTFISQTDNGGAPTFSCSPSWVRVADQGGASPRRSGFAHGAGQAMGVQTMAPAPPGVKAPGAAGAPEAAVLTWLSPAGGDTVEWGDAFELRWEVSIPTSDAVTGSLWVSSAATEEWALIADDLDADSGRYVWDAAVAPGQYRFGIRLADGGSWAELIESDWLEVLQAHVPALAG